MANEVDIKENELLAAHPKVFKQLLYDHSTRKNIFWATDSYVNLNEGYAFHDEITIDKITGDKGNVIRPRAIKSRDEQNRRVKDMAEVFTPSSICKKMNDAVFVPDILTTYLEITCGEAPFLVSRYDTVTGEPIPIEKRIGILDRKLQIVNHQATDEEYAHDALLALGSVYGYEWQGDNLFLAREAVLTTFAEYYQQRCSKEPDEALLLKAAKIVSWNLWQMDGLKAVVPDTCHETTSSSLDLFAGEQSSSSPCPGCAKDDILLHNGIRCRLRRWLPSDNSKSPYGIDSFEFSFLDIINKKSKNHNKIKYTMNFDYIIGNPPYQDETIGDNKGFAPPVYDKFIDGAYQIGDKVELIHPARFLFNAGSTPKQWNKKMLNDPHLKVLSYEPDASKIFPNTDIKGGVVVTCYDKENEFGAIDVFTPYNELNSILHKVIKKDGEYLSKIAISRTSYRMTDTMHKENPNAIKLLSKGHPYDMSTNIFELLPFIFYNTKPNDGHEYIQILGRENNERVYKYIRRDYVNDVVNLNSYKVILPKASGTGAFGETIAPPIIGKPGLANTETFLSIGNFSTGEEADNLLKFIRCKFTRALLDVVKVTQDITPDKFKYVPLQDFTSSSDIDWSKSIHDIDLQLYAKYGLDAAETAFIEKNVKPMS